MSAISAFEVGTKHRRGSLALPSEPRDWYPQAIRLHGLQELPVNGTIALQSTQLPMIHKDPADRIIVATAQVENLTILTPDPLIRAYPDVRVEW